MRHSRQRQLILDLVRSRALDHPTAQSIHDAVRDHMAGVSLGTVYRNLHQLVEAGEISAVPGEGPVHYDWRLAPHQHLHCRICGSLVDLDLDLAEEARQRAEVLGHRLDEIDFHLRGTCTRCLIRSESTP
ncbi:MAG: transcriptional repressor [bacterium]|jgi:Fe2+ or Zn2+ uptake regulation protein|nr:transcriptional repressor [bacterium]